MKNLLVEKHCKACGPGTKAMPAAEIDLLLGELPGWEAKNGEIFRTYNFENYHQTMAFVNGVAWVAHREDHHPDLEVGYNRCKVRFSTHSAGGLTENDFISAAKVNALLE